MSNLEKEIDRDIIASPIIDLVDGYSDEDVFWEEKYDTTEFWEAVQNSIRWAIDYNNKYKD